MTSDYKHEAETRALQASTMTRAENLRSMVRWGAYNLIKVVARGAPREDVQGYVTHQAAISGKSPREIETILGLRRDQLAEGADLYRLTQLPHIDAFLPRGYTTLVDGLELREGLSQDAGGYRPGHGAWQIMLTGPVPATRIASLGPDDVFEPGLHPDVARLYSR